MDNKTIKGVIILSVLVIAFVFFWYAFNKWVAIIATPLLFGIGYTIFKPKTAIAAAAI